MPLLLTVLGIISALGFWLWRMRDAADTVGDLVDMAGDIKSAARRFGFRRNHNRHPVEDIEDPAIAIAGVAVCFLELDDLPTQEERDAMTRGLQSELNLNMADAQEITILGRWMMTQCGGPSEGVDRMARKLWKLDKSGGQFQPLMGVLKTMLEQAEGPMNDKQQGALEDIKAAFKIR